MNSELMTKRPAEVVTYARPRPVLTAVVRPIAPRPVGIIQRVMSPADWPWSVVLLLHAALAGAVVSPFILLAMYLDR